MNKSIQNKTRSFSNESKGAPAQTLSENSQCSLLSPKSQINFNEPKVLSPMDQFFASMTIQILPLSWEIKNLKEKLIYLKYKK